MDLILENCGDTISYEQFISKMNCAIQQCTEQNKSFGKIITFNKKSQSWWNEECTQAVESCKTALHLFKNYPILENYIAYKKSDALVKRTTNSARREEWKTFCNKINKSKNERYMEPSKTS
ncbi:hypothetical protein WA026_007636 [Henosepilachna vigintioctopunctata]|uniref:Uncharacterized protein n=1 Tax=Henosepilachna vigintioctopunctata TaxID=420089 RepID=A0AAW1U3Z4_9CUCU